jgi:S1-C subfamily serine protease
LAKIDMNRFLPIASLLILFLAGCASYRQSDTTRDRSFEPHAGLHVGQDKVGTFLRLRTAILITSERDLFSNLQAGATNFTGNGGFGCAAAVDPRGYFLTAAHCLDREFVYLFVYGSTNAWIAQPRIVWKGNRHQGQPDLALLHVEAKLIHTFDCADDMHKDDAVMAVGLSLTNKPRFGIRGFQFLGGRILDSHRQETEQSDFNVATDVPLQSGDSGGPLVDLDGRLIGINVKGTPPSVHYVLPKTMFPMRAEHPNHKWLRETIEEDVAKHSIGTAGSQSVGADGRGINFHPVLPES